MDGTSLSFSDENTDGFFFLCISKHCSNWIFYHQIYNDKKMSFNGVLRKIIDGYVLSQLCGSFIFQ